MKLTDTSVRYIVAAVVLFILVGFSYANISGNNQDEEFETANVLYQQAIAQLQEGNYEQSLELLKQVETVNPDSAKVKQYLGLSLASTGDYATAAEKYEKTIELNPHMIEDSLFMIQYANILILTEQKEAALVVLEQCESLRVPEEMPDYKEQVAKLIKEANDRL